jgi:hypothetical protein
MQEAGELENSWDLGRLGNRRACLVERLKKNCFRTKVPRGTATGTQEKSARNEMNTPADAGYRRFCARVFKYEELLPAREN